MAKFLLSLHVLAAIVAIGPVTVAASMFPRRARAALEASGGATERAEAAASVKLLYRITQVYALLGIAVPVLGVGLAQVMGVMGSAWLITSLVLTSIAALVLLVLVLPRQEAVVAALAGEEGADAAQAAGGLKLLAMSTGIFSLLWAVVTVLMVVRPGSSTGA
ncbi:membrane protein [Kitasatospora nipponensis]|uniref:Membrane protein n=1 Tax=Kitasatospora nipponensis TaxID=258049 RepID=A0ABP4GZQ6_9ACTN